MFSEDLSSVCKSSVWFQIVLLLFIIFTPSSSIIPAGSTASSSTQSEGVPSAVGDELYAYTMSIVDTKEIE
jgi:hypothetical protein